VPAAWRTPPMAGRDFQMLFNMPVTFWKQGDVPAADAPRVIERMLRAYLDHRRDEEEAFQDLVKRYPTDALRELFERHTEEKRPVNV